jgi:hypothetical protein
VIVLKFPRPSALRGEQLRQELAAVGLLTDVIVDGDELILSRLDEPQRIAAAAVIAAHRPVIVPPVDPDAELRKAIEGARTIAELKAALLGTQIGALAAVAARKKEQG